MSQVASEAPQRRGVVAPLAPMLATPARLPLPTASWAFEYKWDGIRACITVAGGRATILSRNGNDVTSSFPEVAALGTALLRDVVLDGEIVALNADARPDFGLLQNRLGLNARDAGAMSKRVPCHFFAFDLLAVEGESLLDEDYDERRRRLASLRLKGPAWSVPPGHPGPADAALAASQEIGLEGIVAKRRDSRYHPGRRTDAWLKVRNHMRQEFVVGGWTEGQGARHGTLGAILVGYHSRSASAGVTGAARTTGKSRKTQGLVYAGKVGTGFGRDLPRLLRDLKALQAESDPFLSSDERVDEPTHFVRPDLVVDVEFADVTAAGILRHASYKGLRTDKPAREVVWEQVT